MKFLGRIFFAVLTISLVIGCAKNNAPTQPPPPLENPVSESNTAPKNNPVPSQDSQSSLQAVAIEPIGKYKVKRVTCLIEQDGRPLPEDCTEKYGDVIEIKQEDLTTFIFEEKRGNKILQKLTFAEENSSSQVDEVLISKKSYFRQSQNLWAYEAYIRFNSKEQSSFKFELTSVFGSITEFSLTILEQSRLSDRKIETTRHTFHLEK